MKLVPSLELVELGSFYQWSQWNRSLLSPPSHLFRSRMICLLSLQNHCVLSLCCILTATAQRQNFQNAKDVAASLLRYPWIFIFPSSSILRITTQFTSLLPIWVFLCRPQTFGIFCHPANLNQATPYLLSAYISHINISRVKESHLENGF